MYKSGQALGASKSRHLNDGFRTLPLSYLLSSLAPDFDLFSDFYTWKERWFLSATSLHHLSTSQIRRQTSQHANCKSQGTPQLLLPDSHTMVQRDTHRDTQRNTLVGNRCLYEWSIVGKVIPTMTTLMRSSTSRWVSGS